MDLTGKKLLVLGGDVRSKDIVETAQQLGVYTIVTDWWDTTRSPAKLVADEYWNEEIFRPDVLADLVKKHHVDGVITGFSDIYLPYYQQLCELAGLPCYSSKEIFETTLDKCKFKTLCRENGVPTVPEFDAKTFNPDIISSQYKIIIKPVDNSGSRGIKVCDNPNTYQECLNYALSFSEKKEVLIERFMDMDSVSMFYTAQDGNLSLSTMNDTVLHKSKDGGGVAFKSFYPSKYLAQYQSKWDEKVRAMYKNLGVQNGVLFLQGFTNGEEFYFFEMGYRLSGGRHYVFTEPENGTNAVKQLIHFAITGKMADEPIREKDNPAFRHYCCRVNILGKEGTIAKIEGADYLLAIPEAVDVRLLKKPGDVVGQDGTTLQTIAVVNMMTSGKEHFDRVVGEINSHFKVYDAEGNNMVLDLNRY